jgi:hypothetical protein
MVGLITSTELPAVLFHEYVKAPDAVNVALSPAQIELEADDVTVITGKGFTTTLQTAPLEETQPLLSVPVTV